MMHKRIYLYLLLALLLICAVGIGCYLWRSRHDIDLPRGTLVQAEIKSPCREVIL